MICACTDTSSAETSSSATRHSGSSGQTAGDGNALSLAAGEFMRQPVGRIQRQPDQVQQFVDALIDLVGRAQLVHANRLAQRLAHRHARVERGERILEDHLHAAMVGAQR